MKNIIRKLYTKCERSLSGHGFNQYSFVRSSSEFLRSRLKSNYVEIDGQKMFLDSLDSMRLSINGIYDEFETKTLKKIIKTDDVVFDIGANIGYYTLIFARLVGRSGKVFSFEPESTNFELLKKNAKINGYTNIEFFCKAISNSNKTTKLFLDKKNKGGHSLIDKIEDRESIEIKSIRIDDYFKNQNIDFVKIDIEGFEFEAIKGMSELLEKSNNVKIMTEFNPYLLKKSEIEPEEYIKLLKNLGFTIYNLDKKKRSVIPINLNDFLRKYSSKNQDSTNLLCVKNKNYKIDV